MQFQTPLIRATLIRRYKRFLADVILPDGTEVTAHCANPGAMTGLMDMGATVWIEANDDPKRKLKYSWKLIELAGGHFACIDTAMPNALVAQAIQGGQVAELTGYSGLRREVNYGQNSRIDFLLTDSGKPDTYVEVKAVTLKRSEHLAEFPDTVTKRGTKHLEELANMVAEGHRAVMFYLVHRSDCAQFKIAADIDPVYAKAFDRGREAGIEICCYGTDLSPEGVKLSRQIAIDRSKQFTD